MGRININDKVDNILKRTPFKRYEHFKNTKDKFGVMCNKKHIYYINYDSLKVKKHFVCKDCLRKERFLEIKKILEKERCVLLEEYKNAKTPIKCICPKGHITKTLTWANWQGGKRYSICNESKGENRISLFLDENEIEYIREKTFEDCRYNGNLLYFDFYLPKNNICIEYDGRQHFESVNFFGGNDGLKERKIRDSFKDQYCKEKNIKICRIPYWDFDKIEGKLISQNLQRL